MVEAVGRDRRRKGPIARLRRLMYGVLLLAAAPGVACADELAYVGKVRHSTPASSPYASIVQATIEGLVLLHADPVDSPDTPIQGNGYPRVALDSVNARVFQAASSNPSLVKLTVLQTGQVRDGVGFDMRVPDLGNFHLNLYSRRNARTEGRRWAMNMAEGVERRTWSVGGSLEVVRTLDGDRQVAFVPELLLDLSDGNALPFQATVKYANWRSVSDKTSLDEKVPQITFKWRL